MMKSTWGAVLSGVAITMVCGQAGAQAQPKAVSPASVAETEPAATSPAEPTAEPMADAPVPAAEPAPTPAAEPASVTPPPPPPQSDPDKLVERFEVGGVLGYGIQLDDEPTKPFGVLLAGRGAIVLPGHIYVGAMLAIFAGQSDSFTYNGVRYTGRLWQSQLGLEGGYDLDLGPLTLRPYAGLGLNHTVSSVTVSYGFDSATYNGGDRNDLYVTAGGMVHLAFTKRIYGGVDTRLTLATTSPARVALALGASGGMRFF